MNLCSYFQNQVLKQKAVNKNQNYIQKNIKEENEDTSLENLSELCLEETIGKNIIQIVFINIFMLICILDFIFYCMFNLSFNFFFIF